MSLAAQFIRAAIETGATKILRDVRLEHLLEEERPLFTFCRNHLSRHGQLPEVSTLHDFGFDIVRGREPATFYAEQIRTRFAYTQINALHPAFAKAMKDYKPDKAIELAREMIQSVGGALSHNQYSTLREQLHHVIADYEEARMNPGLRGVTMGWPTLDDCTLGAQGGDLIVIAGRPSMGKSYLLLQCAHAAWINGHSCIFISMEMTLLQIARRWIGINTGINPRLIHKGTLSKWAENHLRHTVTSLDTAAPVHFLAGDMEQNVQGIVRMAEEFCPDIIYIDAAYLLEPSLKNLSGAKLWEQLKRVIKELKQLAVAINRAIVLTVQFNKSVKSDSQKKADMGGIGGTDAIPQDANVVLGARYGRPPFQGVQRYVDFMKCREGETADFAINFRFNPVDFSEVPIVMPAGEAGQPLNVGWMT